ncbi:MAG: helix-turn-helix transcriptional regulator, partial [Oscillospiraceae bacterium]|nr:helix-turn-helix transcriptional regulator [Oscillospiraceae bacterium]
MNNKELEAIGLRIRERRMALDLTQTALAQRLGITAQAVSKWETGMGCPDIYVLPKLASALEISTDALLGLAPMPAVDPE